MIESRVSLRSNVVEKIKSMFPDAVDIDGGIAWETDVIDEESGVKYCVVVDVRVPNTKATQRSEAFDLQAAVEKHASKPGRRTADPEKKTAADAKKAENAAKKEANLAALRKFINGGGLDTPMYATDILNAIPEFVAAGMMPLTVGSLLKVLVESGEIGVDLDEKRKKMYHA